MSEQVFTNCTNAGPISVYVRDGRVTRIRPLVAEEKDFRPWTLEADGKKYAPARKFNLAPYVHAERDRLYSEDRIRYPMKRADFDPNGARNPQNRGKSPFQRISWDEALDLVGSEIRRVQEAHGPSALAGMTSSHHNWGIVGYKMGPFYRFLNMIGYTQVFDNPDSWEGWHWGATHAYGFFWRLGMPEQYDLLEDSLKHAEMIVFWSNDPDSTRGTYTGQDSALWRLWLKQKGVKMVFIDPYFNHTAGLLADKWLAPRMGTDVALGLAIAYVWLTEDLYDKEYVATHTHGFDDWKDYVLGKSDGTPKTPEWAESESTIPAREIRALAREWGRKKTMLAAGGMGGWGGACRSSYGAEYARTMIALAAMQGLGKPGSNIYSTTGGAPADRSFWFPGYAEGGISADVANTAAGFRLAARMWPNGGTISNPQHGAEGQIGYRLRIPEMMHHEKLEWRSKGFCGGSIEMQFKKYQYPASGYPHIQMYYRYGGSFIGTMTETNRFVRAYREGKVPFVVNQAIWFEGETKFADIILPACTNFERWDIGDWAHPSGYGTHKFDQVNHRLIVLQKKCIEPLGESKSDYEIFRLLAQRLGFEDKYTEGGHSDLDWVKRIFNASDLPSRISWEDFERKGYYMVPVPSDRKPTPALRWFAEDRPKDTPDWGPPPWDQIGGKGLQTQSGKIEFVASSLKRFYETDGVDPERPVMGPQYIPSWEGHHTEELYQKYPLQMVSPHPRYTFHTVGDLKDAWSNEIKDHRVRKDDGHYYWIMRMNSKDAAARGIKDGDLIRAFNDRAEVIFAAQVTERVPPGIVHSYESCGDYLPLGEPGYSPDRAGCVNLLTSKRFITPTSPGQAPNSCLVQVEKWER
jgi:trimethylamine-N-oxide reductase (cytochrome c)